MNELKCTKITTKDAGRDHQDRKIIYHEKCGAPAAEYEITGMLTTAKATLCFKHKQLAEREAFLSDRGFKKGQVRKTGEDKEYQQMPMPGIGVKTVGA